MQTVTETFGNVLVAHTPDEMIGDGISNFTASLMSSVQQGQTRIVFQMDRTDAIDSAALTALLDIRDAARQQGGQAKLCGLTATCAKILQMTRLDRRFEIYDSLIDAVGSFR